MERSRLLNALVVLLIIIAALYLAQMLWQLISGFADLILLFVLGWLVSFILNPVVAQVSAYQFSPPFLKAISPVIGTERALHWQELRLPRPVAVLIVYFGLVLALALAIALLIPPAIAQSSQMANQLPEYMARAQGIGTQIGEQLAGWGVRPTVENAFVGVLGNLQNVLTSVVQNALGIFTTFLGLLADLFFVLILGFYFTLDGPRLGRALLRIIPEQYEAQVLFFARSVDRTFGGFIRGQLVQAVLIGVGTAAAMTLLGMNYVLVASLLSALVMLIPLVGPILALIPPVFLALLQSPGMAPWLLLGLFVYQFVIVNVLMPRILSDALGLHPLLVFAAILLSVKVAGFWGAFFGIPVAGVLWAMLEFFFKELHVGPPSLLPSDPEKHSEPKSAG